MKSKCGDCGGRGQVADYVGLEMRCVGVTCDTCGGSGEAEQCRICTVSIPSGELCFRHAHGNDPFKVADNCGADLAR